MEISGTQYFCDSKSCKNTQFLEDGEEITDMGWIRIDGEGLFCEECAANQESIRADERAEANADWNREERLIPYASAVRATLNGEV